MGLPKFSEKVDQPWVMDDSKVSCPCAIHLSWVSFFFFGLIIFYFEKWVEYFCYLQTSVCRDPSVNQGENSHRISIATGAMDKHI